MAPFLECSGRELSVTQRAVKQGPGVTSARPRPHLLQSQLSSRPLVPLQSREARRLKHSTFLVSLCLISRLSSCSVWSFLSVRWKTKDKGKEGETLFPSAGARASPLPDFLQLNGKDRGPPCRRHFASRRLGERGHAGPQKPLCEGSLASIASPGPFYVSEITTLLAAVHLFTGGTGSRLAHQTPYLCMYI